jgi:hypothetical protein
MRTPTASSISSTGILTTLRAWDAITDGDHDGIPDGSDPSPGDSSNYSFANGISWGADAFGDSDADGVANFYDAYPYDSGNGYVPPEPDADGDGIPGLIRSVALGLS